MCACVRVCVRACVRACVSMMEAIGLYNANGSNVYALLLEFNRVNNRSLLTCGIICCGAPE